MKKILSSIICLLSLLLISNLTYAQQPTVNASNVITVGKTTTSISINWTNGNGSNRIVTCALSTSGTSVPNDGTAYTQNSTFGAGSNLGNANYVVYNGSGSGCNAFGLTPGTAYRIRIYEYLIGVNGFDFSYENYLTSGYPNYLEYTLTTEPTTNASAITATNIAQNSATLSFTSGNGTYELLSLRASSSYANTPVDGTSYSASTVYGNGTSLLTSSPASYVLTWGTATSANVSNLAAGTTYTAAAFAFNGGFSTYNYMTSSYPTKTFTTLAAQPTSASNTLSFSNVTNSSMTVSWTIPSSGAGVYRIVTCKPGTTNTDLPSDATNYTANANYGSGSLVGSAYVVYNGTGNHVNVTGLNTTQNYSFSVFEYNVATNTYNLTYNYLTSSYLNGYAQTLSAEPTVPASSLVFSNITSNSVRATWANGNGGRRNVGVRAGRIQTGLAFDGTNDYVSIPNESNFDFTSQMTVEAWIKVNAFTTAFQTIVAKGSGTWRIQRYASTNFIEFTVNIGGINRMAIGSRNVNDGKWHHIAGVYNGSQVVLYVDGTVDSYSSATGNIDQNNYQMSIGENLQDVGRYFNGQIDEVRVWNYAQPAGNISSYMNKTLVGNEYGLKGYWKLDDGFTATSTAKNSSLTSSIDGTLTGFASTAAATNFTNTSGWILSGAVVNVPLDFNTYSSTSAFFSTSNSNYYYGGAPTFMVYQGPDSTSVTVTGLSPNTYYNFGVFERNGTTGDNNYLTNSYATADVLTSSISAPTITSFSPASGFVGSIVTINGTNFNPTASSNTVYFGSTKATVVSANAGGTQLTVKVPPGSTLSPISVTNNTLTAYSTKAFIVTSPCGSTNFAANTLNTAQSANGYYSYNDVRVADMDLDGLPDLVGLYPYSYTGITRNTSTGGTVNFSSTPYYLFNTYGITDDFEIADLDGDGRIDVAMTSSYNSNASFVTNKNISTPANINFGNIAEFAGNVGYTPSDIAIADLDKDGKPDVIMSHTNNVISIYRNISSIHNIQFAPKVDITLSGSAAINSIAVGDIDGDGKMDIATAGGSGSMINTLRNTSSIGSISFAAFGTTSLSGTITGVAIGDIDNDLKADILYGASASTVGVLKNNSTVGNISISTSPTSLTTLANTPSEIKLGDIDGDGKLDITVGYNTGTQMSIFKNNSTATFSIATKFDFSLIASTSNPKSLALCDLNGDNKMDIVSAGNNQNFSYFQNNINPLVSEPTVSASSMNFSGTTTTQTTLNFTAGNGANRVIFVRASTSAAFAPTDGVGYVPNTIFGSGSDIGGGNYCVYDGNSNSVTVTGLESNTNYVFSVYEYNGALNCEYNYLVSGTSGIASVTTNNTTPTLTAISNPASICQNTGLQTINLSGIGTGSGNEVQTLTVTATSSNIGLIPHPTVTYTSPNATGSLSYTPVNGVSGTAIITVTVNDGASNNNIVTRTFTVTVDHLPTTSVAGTNQQICPSVGTLAGNTPAYGTGLWTIIATTNGAITITDPNDPTTTVNNFNINDSATFRWTISNGACASSGNNVRVKRISCPTTADFTVNSTSECLNINPTVTFTNASVASGATIISWNWSFGAGAFPANATGAGPHTVTYSTAGAKTIVLSVQDNLSATDTEIKTGFVTINDVPEPATNISGSTTVCQGQTGVNYSVAAVNGATGYTWNLPSGATLISGVNTNSITVDFGTNAISGNISVRGTNSCGNGTLSANFPVTVNPLPAAAGTISGSTSVCEGTSSVAYSIPTAANATSYTWNINGGASIVTGAGTNAITVNYPLGTVADGTLSVYATNSCGNGTSNAINISIDSLPEAADQIAGQALITTCPSTTGVQYSIPLVNNATTYNWTVPTGVTITSGTGTNVITVDYTPSAVSGNITVTPSNTCGDGAMSTLSVTVNTLPDMAGSISGSDSLTVCPASNGINFSLASVFNADYYIWSLPSGATIVSGDSTNSISVNFADTAQSGTITVTPTNACGTGAPATFNIYIDPVPTQNLCMVTVDDVSLYNKVIWEKPVTTAIDSFRIYREITSSFVHIASVPYDSLSEYVDDTFAPLADPNTTNFRYKISAVDTCGNEGALSDHHRTIFLQANQGVGNVINLNWVPYEGATVTYYYILRDTLGSGVFEVIDSVPGSNTVYTDLNPPITQSSVRYVLECNWATTCTPTRATINTTRSNIKSAAYTTIGIAEVTLLENEVNVYPNPTSNTLNVQYPLGFKDYTIVMFDALGKVVYNEQLNDESGTTGSNIKQINVESFAKGMYILSVQTSYGSIHKRVVIQ
ncbi:MAG: VCBS repeat-containing protein [Bacteroidetes bacterium]|nr:VCBS repeat-containing protein [Bacteroidota bacterium]